MSDSKAQWRDDISCNCRTHGREPCWPHKHRYIRPGSEMGHIECQHHGHNTSVAPGPVQVAQAETAKMRDLVWAVYMDFQRAAARSVTTPTTAAPDSDGAGGNAMTGWYRADDFELMLMRLEQGIYMDDDLHGRFREWRASGAASKQYSEWRQGVDSKQPA